MNVNLKQAYQTGRQRGAAFLAGQEPRTATVLSSRLAQQIGWPMEKVMSEIATYDRERLDAVPSLITYPELGGCRDRIDAEDRGMRDAGVSTEMIALSRTLGFYTMTRLYQQTGRAFSLAPEIEECRTLFVPESDVGPIHAKNVDGPLIGWSPHPPIPNGAPWPFSHPIVLDGVGSGLHIDEIPSEIFPVNIYDLTYEHCVTVDAATELLVRYNYFWGHCNLIVYDPRGDSMAFEKTQCRVATRGPNRHGMNFISGMSALDPGIRDHQRRMRQTFLDQMGSDWNGPDGCFWRESEQTYLNMAAYIEQLPARPTLRQVRELMERHDPGGPLCYIGAKSHPDQLDGCWSRTMNLFLVNQRKQIRRQVRDAKPAFLDPPEVIEYGPPVPDAASKPLRRKREMNRTQAAGATR